MEIGIYMLFEELVHAEKQFVELAGHFVVMLINADEGDHIFFNGQLVEN